MVSSTQRGAEILLLRVAHNISWLVKLMWHLMAQSYCLSLSLSLHPYAPNLFLQGCIFIIFTSILLASIGRFVFIYTINCSQRIMYYPQVRLLHFFRPQFFVEFLLNLNSQYIFYSSTFCELTPSLFQLYSFFECPLVYLKPSGL